MTTTTTTGEFSKVLRLGFLEGGISVYAKVLWDGKRLSISGVEGPMKGGNCRGSCGQINMGLGQGEEIEPAQEWTSEGIAEFLKTWDRWHLNDMRPGCEHQRAWDVTAKLEIVTYRLIYDPTVKEQNRIKEDSAKRLRAGETVTLTDEERALLALPWETLRAPDADSLGSGRYEVNKRETKAAGWVYPTEHPGGLLTKPCEVCGYKYGSAWLKEEVPAEVIAYFRALPDTDVTPAWI